MIGTHLFGLLNVFQAGLELVPGNGGSPPVFSVYGMEKFSTCQGFRVVKFWFS
jgi:hypothetical protein